MGDFVVHVHAVGNHGCQRDKKPGEQVEDCGSPGCTDCITRRYVKALKDSGAYVQSALLTHWPQSTPVLDDLRTGIRVSSF